MDAARPEPAALSLPSPAPLRGGRGGQSAATSRSVARTRSGRSIGRKWEVPGTVPIAIRPVAARSASAPSRRKVDAVSAPQDADRAAAFAERRPDVVVVGAEVGGFPGRRAGQGHLAGRRLAEARLDIVGELFRAPGPEGAPAGVGLDDGGLAGKGRPPAVRAHRQRIVLQRLRIGRGSGRHHHGIEQGERLHPRRLGGGGQQAGGPAHGVAGQHHRPVGDRGREGQEVVAELRPALAALDGGGERRRPVAAQVDGQDPQAVGERGEDAAVGSRVEAVGVGEDHVHRAARRSEVERRHGPAPARQVDRPRARQVVARGVHSLSPHPI